MAIDRLRCSIDPLMIDPPEGMAYKWVVTESVRWFHPLKTDPIVDAQAHGWVLVPEDRHPEFAFPHGLGGAVLMERPKAEADAAMAQLTDRALGQERDAPDAIARNFSDMLASLPVKGFTLALVDFTAAHQCTTMVATPAGWISATEYEAGEREDGTNWWDDEVKDAPTTPRTAG